MTGLPRGSSSIRTASCR
ncbi:MAG: hypothetical protein H0W18_08320 [Acidobacteria bacterium]|nr:hypothetical protein [Acidobacteriota bacterium]